MLGAVPVHTAIWKKLYFPPLVATGIRDFFFFLTRQAFLFSIPPDKTISGLTQAGAGGVEVPAVAWGCCACRLPGWAGFLVPSLHVSHNRFFLPLANSS